MRYGFVDSIRGLAAIAVVLFHLNEVGVWQASLYQDLVKLGWLGVPAFFVVSGFAVSESRARCPTAFDFLQKRFWRIYPPYVASLAITLLAVAYQKFSTGTNDFIVLPKSSVQWLEVLTLMTHPVTATPNINWVYWSLSYEIAFYFILASTINWKHFYWPILFFITLSATLFPEIPVFFFDSWTIFALGVSVSRLNYEKTMAASLAVLCLGDMLLNRNALPSITGCITALGILACLNHKLSWLNKEPLFRHLGAFSYSLYLLHVPISCWLVLSRLDPYPRAASATDYFLHILIDAFALGVSIAAAYLFYIWIEKPSALLAHRLSPIGTKLSRCKDSQS